MAIIPAKVGAKEAVEKESGRTITRTTAKIMKIGVATGTATELGFQCKMVHKTEIKGLRRPPPLVV